MIRIIMTLLFLGVTLNASEKVYATKIIKNIVEVMDKAETSVWLDNASADIVESLELKPLNVVKACKNAKILILSSKKSIPKHCISKPILVLDYALLEKYTNAVSAFYWQKGRPNIVFLKKRLEYFSISLPPTYHKYIEDQIW